jgi:hypothetical protein
MLTGLRHLHETMAYLVFLSAIVSVALTVAGAGAKPNLAKVVSMTSRFGLLMLGRLVVVVGLGMAIAIGHSFAATWIWLSLILWVPVEISGKRLVRPEIAAVMDGDSATNKLAAGVVVQLICVAAIFALMSIRP